MLKPTKHLTLRGNTWWFQKALTKEQALVIGKKNYAKSLGTDSLREAQALRGILLKELEQLAPKNSTISKQQRMRRLVNEIRDLRKEAGSDQSLHDALDYRFDVETAVNDGDGVLADAILIAGDNSPKNTNITLSYTIEEVGKDYLTQIARTKGTTTVNATKRAMEYLTVYLKGDKAINQIKRSQVVGFIQWLVDVKKLSSKSIKSLLSTLTGVYRYGYDRDYYTTENPFSGHKVKEVSKDDTKARRTFTPQEFGQLMSEVNNSNRTSLQRKWIAPIALVSGLRLAEVSGLYKEDVIEKDGVWCFKVQANADRGIKTDNSSRIVPIHSSVLEAVLSFKESSSNRFLFEEMEGNANIGGSVGTWFSRVKRRVLNNVGEELCFHSLRKNYSTALENAGVDEKVAVELLGHDKISLSYGLYSDGLKASLLKEAVDQAGNELTEFVKSFPTQIKP